MVYSESPSATFHFRSLICISDRDFRTETSDCWLVHCLQPLLLRTSEVCFQQLTDYQRPCSPLQSLVLCPPRFTLDCSQNVVCSLAVSTCLAHDTTAVFLNWLRLQHGLLLVSRFVGFGRTGHACPALHCDVMSRNPSVTMSTMRVYNNSEGFGSRTQDCQKSSSRCRMRQFVLSARNTE